VRRRLPSVRPFVFWPHLVAGVSAGLVILLMSVTGVLLTYERQVIAWADRSYRAEPPQPGTPRLPVETLLARIAEQRGAPAAITIASEPATPVIATVDQQALAIDPYTGVVLGPSAPAMRRVMSEIRAWHRWLSVDGARRPIARAITGWANAVFLLIVCSGLFLWFPRTWSWTQVRGVVFFKSGLRGKARDFNWHNTVGAWSALPLFVIVFCALPMSFGWFNDLVYRAAGDRPPAAGGAARAERRSEHVPSFDGIDDAWSRAEQQVAGWKTITLRLPGAARAPLTFAIDRGDGGQPQLRSTLTLDRATAGVIGHETFADQSAGRRLRSMMRFAHTGEILGIPGQTVAGLVSAGGALLVWTGLSLALRRFTAWRRRRAGNDVAVQTARVSAA
jgi:uncharacterized iron-regulated membrane protein